MNGVAGPGGPRSSRLHLPSAETMRASMWVLPTACMVGVLALTFLLLQYRPDTSTLLQRWLWPGGPSSASSAMQTLATAVVTAASLTFSAVIVALQLASQQFSPRLLRDFTRDRLTQIALGTLLSTFASSLTVLRSLHPDRPLPVAALCWAYLLGLVSVGLLMAFLAHIMRQLRVDTMMRTVHRQAVRTLDGAYPDYDAGAHRHPPPDRVTSTEAAVVRAPGSGFCERIDVDALVRAAAAADAYVRVLVRPGDQVLLGTPVLYAWRGTGAGIDEHHVTAMLSAVELGYERTFEQDTAFGFRRLADIAVKAISPSVNDPATAAQAIGHLGDLLIRLMAKQLGPTAHRDTRDTVRVTVPDRDIRYYLDMTCAQIRRYGRHDPVVLTAVLRVLRDAAVSARDDAQRTEIRRQTELILTEIPNELPREDRDGIRTAADRVGEALNGRLAAAFDDRSGELRSS
ncbi:MAG TPA: DUF2254 domain-containing protein [Pilimelia sp.]|nr:DUF2254 domain-containing protein [Pilimelia sp.]